jgi:hypothetical protein
MYPEHEAVIDGIVKHLGNALRRRDGSFVPPYADGRPSYGHRNLP